MRAALGVVRPQGRGQNRYVVDAFGVDQRRQDPESLRMPVLVGIDGVVETDQCLGTRLANLELYRRNTDAGPRDGVDVLHAVDLRQHLLQRNRHQVLDLGRARTGERHEHVGKGDVDLRFFFAGRDGNREEPHQQKRQGEERGERIVLEPLRDAARKAETFTHRC